MLGLLYKDIVILKKDLLILVFGILGASMPLFLPWGNLFEKSDIDTAMINEYTMTFVIMPFITYLFVFQLISMVQGNIFAHDERKVWNSYIVSSPVGRNSQVLSKYYMILALSFVGFVWGMVCDAITSVISGTNGSAMMIYAVLFFGQVLMRAFELPFLIKFGQKHGRTYKLLISAVIAFLAIVYLLFGKLPENMSVEALVDWVLRLSMNQETMSMAMLGTVAVCPYLIMLLYYLSYKLSCRLYQKGEMLYEV